MRTLSLFILDPVILPRVPLNFILESLQIIEHRMPHIPRFFLPSGGAILTAARTKFHSKKTITTKLDRYLSRGRDNKRHCRMLLHCVVFTLPAP